MQSEKYIIIIDTNFLGSYDKNNELISKNFKYLSVGKAIFASLIEFVKSNSLTDSISIAIPKLVFEEIKEQEKRDFNKQIGVLDNTFSKFVEIDGFELKKGDINFEDHLSKKISAFIGKYKIICLDYPQNIVFPKLIDKVLKKHKPFYKNSRHDSGFKDSIIWESILEYAKNNKQFIYIFLTKDPDFNDKKLLEEFENIVGSKLILKEELSQVKAVIDEHLKLKLEFTEILNLYNQLVREKIIQIVSHCYPLINYPTNQFRIVDYILSHQINDIKGISNKEYELYIPIILRHETIYTGYSVVDELYSHYEYNNFQDTLVLKIEKEGTNYFIKDIHFISDRIQKINECMKIRFN